MKTSTYHTKIKIPINLNFNSTDIDEEDKKSIAINKYRDPGHYLEVPKVNGVKPDPDAADTKAKPDVVRGLASALLQVSQAIHQKYLKRPLGKYT